MTRYNRRTVAVCLACCAAALAISGWIAVVASESGPADSSSSVLLTITVGDEQGDKSTPSKSYSLIAVAGSTPTRMFSGSRVPIASTTFQTSQPPREVVPMTSYVYQNVGFEANVRVLYVQRGQVHLEASIEESSIPGGLNQRPTVSTTQQELKVSLKDGVPLQIARAGSSYLSIRADVLD